MISKISSKLKLVGAIFGCIFGILGLIFPLLASPSVYADEPTSESRSASGEITTPSKPQNTTQNTTEEQNTTTEQNTETKEVKTKTCDASLGSLGWLVCPTTGKISEAVDWLYDRIENLLIINPVEIKEESPIYQIWRYFLGISNLAFVIFLLIAIFSQITGVGISNYGIKKILPKLIIAAILVNLSFLICSLAVDVSNIIGDGLRGIFTSIEEATIPDMMAAGGASSADAHMSMARLYTGLSDGTSLATVAGVIAFEGGEIWLLIPAVLGAIVSVVIGLITIALRQVVVILLIMIVPLAVVAYMLPNTEGLFKKWKNLFVKMLVFYPMYSLLFGASSLAGWAIILAANDGFGLILGVVVQIFPLFFSWSLMKMSGTFLGTINAKLTGMFAKPLATNRAWAESHKELTKQRQLASQNVYTPSLRLRQFLSDRKIMREEETREHAETVKLRGQAYAADRNYKIKGGKKVLSRDGEESHAEMTSRIAYQRRIMEHKNNFNDSVAEYAYGDAQKKRVELLDANVVRESDRLKMETARGELIDYRNAVGFHDRMEDAMNAHFDETVGYKLDKSGNRVPKSDYAFHFDDKNKARVAMDRYNDALKIMHGNHYDAQYAAAVAAHSRDSQQKIHDNRLQKYAELLPPTRDVEYRLKELIDAVDKASDNDTIKNIDAIISFMRVLNQRGDTDLVSKSLYEVLSHGVEVGSHASQALAGFSMFEVKDADPFLRRFGKYINLETAQVFNKNKRKNKIITLDEFVTGRYEEDDPDNPGQKIVRYSKRPMSALMEGTSLDGVERTAYGDGEMIMMHPYMYDDKNDLDENGKPVRKLDVKKYFAKRKQVDWSMEPQFISASLKYLSGSEQLKSAVKYKTGYYSEVMVNDETGEIYKDENGDPLYESVAVWEKKDRKDNPFIDDVETAKEYYRSQTMGYLWNQTPIQILQLRSDYYDPLREHLADTFLMNKDEDLTADEKQAKEEYLAEVARINEVYGPNPKGKAKVARNNELKKARHKIAGKEMIKWLDERGTLEQVYRSRRSGAANAAKPWVREWLGLDNEVMIRAYEKKKRAEQEAEKKRANEASEQQNGGDAGGESQQVEPEPKKSQSEDEEIEKLAKALAKVLNRAKYYEMREKHEKHEKEEYEDDSANIDHSEPSGVGVYSASDQDEFINDIEDLYYTDDNKHNPDEFYEQAYDYLKSKLSQDSYVVVSLSKMYKDDPAADSHTIKSWILELLDDLENY